MAGDSWLSPGSCGVKLGQFEAMSQQMDKAAPALEDLAQQMWAILNSAGVDTGPATKVRSIARWAGSAAGDIRRRVRLVHEMDRRQFTYDLCTPQGTYFTMPDRYNDQLAAFEGRTAADLLQKAAKGDRAALNKLAGYVDRASDPHFAKALLEAIGPEGIATLPAGLVRGLRSDIDVDERQEHLAKDVESAQAALKMLCRSLATGTDPEKSVHLDDAFLQQLTGAGRSLHKVPNGGSDETVRGYQSVATILNFFSGSPPFSLHFMQTVGRDMVAYDRELYAHWRGKPVRADLGKSTPLNSLGGWTPLGDLAERYKLGPLLNPSNQLPAVPFEGRTDFLRPLLAVASTSKGGAQTLLDYTAPGLKNSNLEYLLHERRSVWARTDHGAELGQTLQTAVSGHDDTSQKLFKEMSELLGHDVRQFYSYDKDHKLKFADVHGGADDLSGMRYSLGQIMRAHLADIDDSLFGEVLGLDGSLLTSRDIDAVLVEVGQDDKAFAALVRDQIGRTRALLDRQYASGKGMEALLISEGKLFGHLLAMRRETLIARGVKIDEANGKTKGLIDQGIGLIPVPYSDLFGEVSKGAYEQAVTSQYGKIGDWLAKRTEQGGGSAEQDSNTAGDQQAVVKLLRQMSLSVSVNHAAKSGINVTGQSFADEDGKFLPVGQWAHDPKKVRDFVTWCKENNFQAPRISEAIQTSIGNSHNDALDSFNKAKSGDLSQ